MNTFDCITIAVLVCVMVTDKIQALRVYVIVVLKKPGGRLLVLEFLNRV